MSMYYCVLCDQPKDKDWVIPYEFGDDLICEDCHVEKSSAPIISYNTYLNFLRFTYPEKSEDQIKAEARNYMQQQHKFYRGPNND